MIWDQFLIQKGFMLLISDRLSELLFIDCFEWVCYDNANGISD